MRLIVDPGTLRRIHVHGERAYPSEGAGFLLGEAGSIPAVRDILALDNAREPGARGTRYLITPEDYMRAELRAQEAGLQVIGVFHSHPDHPNRPSEYDRAWAQPNFSYVITSVEQGRAAGSRSWRLREDRTAFDEEELHTTSSESTRTRS